MGCSSCQHSSIGIMKKLGLQNHVYDLNCGLLFDGTRGF